MTKIKAISNPYKQEIKYETYKENTQEWDDMTSFRVQTEVSASPTFFGWVFGFNGKVQILAPESVKEQYRQMIAQADEGMQQKENKEQEI
jgi:predicted DNA-binding transcriptional regulator YafY